VKFIKTHFVNLIFLIALSASNVLAQTSPQGTVSVSNTSSSAPGSVETPKPTIKESVIEDKLFDRPLFEGKAGISLFTEDTVSGKTANTPQNSYAKGYILGNLYATPDLYLSANLRLQSSKGDSTTGNYYFDEGSAFWAELAIR